MHGLLYWLVHKICDMTHHAVSISIGSYWLNMTKVPSIIWKKKTLSCSIIIMNRYSLKIYYYNNIIIIIALWSSPAGIYLYSYRKHRNIGVQKIWRICQKLGNIKYWQIFNLAFVAWMAITFVRATLILAIFNLANCMVLNRVKLPNFMYCQYFCVYKYQDCLQWSCRYIHVYRPPASHTRSEGEERESYF